MIIFHEGLPGTGKTYEAVKEWVVKSLKEGRKVFTNIEGLDAFKISVYVEKTEQEVKDLLFFLDDDKVKTINAHVENDALVVIDELQNYFPSGRQKLSPGITEFVSKHRHLGIDIICLGQDLRDCATMFRRRVDQKVVFTKLGALGMHNSYTWVVHKALQGEKFKKIRSGQKRYDSAIFELYKSHSSETSNTEDIKDDRANVLNTPGIKYGIPLAIISAVFAVNHVINFFNPEPEIQASEKHDTVTQSNNVPSHLKSHVASYDKTLTEPDQSEIVVEKERNIFTVNYIEYMVYDKGYLPRLSGILSDKNRHFGYVEFLDKTNHVKERLSTTQLTSFGWHIKFTAYGLQLINAEDTEKVFSVTSFPIDTFGTVPNRVTNSL